MKTIATAAFFLISTAAYANQYEKYVPLQGGNSWAFEELGVDMAWGDTMKVRASDLMVEGFPMTRGLVRVLFVGTTLCIQDGGQWKPFLNYGVREGQAYSIPDISSLEIRGISVTLVSKNEAVSNAVLEETFRRCIHFRLSGRWGVESVDLHLYFAPNVGLVAWKLSCSIGRVSRCLKEASFNGNRLGAIDFDSTESGNDSFYPGTAAKVAVIRNIAELQRFYRQHRNGGSIPVALQTVDFTRKTVLAVIGPVRQGLGRGVEIQGLFWDRRAGSARILLHELPLGPVLLPRPYEIVVVNGKVDRIRAEWR